MKLLLLALASILLSGILVTTFAQGRGGGRGQGGPPGGNPGMGRQPTIGVDRGMSTSSDRSNGRADVGR